MTIILNAINKYFHSCSNDSDFDNLMHQGTQLFPETTFLM